MPDQFGFADELVNAHRTSRHRESGAQLHDVFGIVGVARILDQTDRAPIEQHEMIFVRFVAIG